MEGVEILLRVTSIFIALLLICVGNTPFTTVQGQGTPARQTTLRPTIPFPATTLRPSRATPLATTRPGIFRSTIFSAMKTSRYAVSGPATVPATVRPGVQASSIRTSPKPNQGSSSTTKTTTISSSTATSTQIPTSTVTTRSTVKLTSPTPKTTISSSLETTGINTFIPTTKKSSVAATQRITSPRPSLIPTTTANMESPSGYVITYLLPVNANGLLTDANSFTKCESENKDDLAAALAISKEKITQTTCEKYSSGGNTVIKVTAETSPDSPPILQRLENIKQGTKSYKPRAQDGNQHQVQQFEYRDRVPVNSVASTNMFLGLESTYWVLIGMGAVVVLLVIISVVVICIGRSDTGVRPESEQEVQDDELDTPKKKKRRFPWQRKKMDDDDIESNNDASDSEHESAYGSNPELDHGEPYDDYNDVDTRSRNSHARSHNSHTRSHNSHTRSHNSHNSRTSSKISDDDKIF